MTPDTGTHPVVRSGSAAPAAARAVTFAMFGMPGTPEAPSPVLERVTVTVGHDRDRPE